MSVKIITGQIGSGKTRYCIESIRKTHENRPECKCIMLVPSYYSHETEKMFAEEFGGTGLNNIEVTSFEKLTRELTKNMKKHLAAPGKQALVCRAVAMCISELEKRQGEFDGRLVNSITKPGFIDIASSLISEMKRYVISSDILKEQSKAADNESLKQKLEILSMICENYDRLLSQTDYIDSDEDLMLLSNVIGDMLDENTHIWIDKFDEFLPQQMKVIYSLIEKGIDMDMTFNVCKNYSDTYYGTVKTIDNICVVCNAQFVRLSGGMEHLKNSPDLKFLFETWFDRVKYSGKVNNAELFEARDSYTEMEHIACKILDLVREDKYRFRDIAVICGNHESYSHIIEAIFDEYDIPYYSDYKISMASHPIAVQILSLFDIVERNWDYSSMFRYLRAGFVYTQTDDGRYGRISDDDIDKLENHVLKYGIRGKKMWNESWLDGRKSIIDEAFGNSVENVREKWQRIDDIRKTVSEPISNYCETSKKAVTVNDYCCAVYEFLESIYLYQGLKTEIFSLTTNQAEKDAQRFSQIWNLMLDILDQLNTALGETKVSQAEFFEYMRAAMTKCEIRTVPSGVDRVFIGSTEKNQAENVKVLFMAGAVSGTFPSDESMEGFLSNADRRSLEDKNINIAPVTNRKKEKLYNSVYKSLSAVTDKLFISYPIQTAEGKSYRPSRLVIDIVSKLNGMKKYDDIAVSPDDEKRLFISSPNATMHKMLIKPKSHALWRFVNDWYNEHGEWKNKLFTVNETRNNFEDRKISLDKKYASSLYDGEVMYSPTRLNTYAKCPFAYFVKYGLKASPRDEWELNSADTGTYAHEIIRLFCETIDGSDVYSWDTLTDKQCEDIINSIVSGTLDNINKSDLTKKQKTSHIFNRMGKTVEKAVKMVRDTISSGEYKTCDYEKNFELKLSDNVGIKGTVDRIDVCNHNGINEYRVIDYKTGKKEFKVEDIYNGIDMQPVIYAAAIYLQNQDSEISGTYYSRVGNDFAKLKSSNKDEQIQKQLKENVQLTGATFVEVDDFGNIIPDSLDRIESKAKRDNESIFFKPDKQGEINLGGNLRRRETSKKLIRHVIEKIKNIDGEIRNGNIEISPVTEYNGGACKYCDFSAVCKFDFDLANPREINDKADDVWEKIEEDEI